MPKPATDKNYTGTCSPPECISAERKTVLRIFLAAFAVLLLFLFAAAPASAYSGGTGSSSDPYNISTAADLKQLATDVNGGTDYTGAYFKVTADIDLSSICNATSDESWEPIGNSSTGSPFAGHFDGGGKIIANLFIDSSEMEQGLFGRTESGSSVKNVSLINATVSGGRFTGSLIGYADGSVANCYAVSNVSGESGVGGLIGVADGSSVSCCYAVSNVTGNGSVGGLIGMTQGSSVSCCYAAGTVSGNESVGGLIGEAYASGGSSITIENCCALNPSVSGSGSVGRIAGYTSDTVTLNNAYALSTMSAGGKTDGTDVSPENATSQSFYQNIGWDFGEIWKMDASISRYPVLQIQSGNSPTVTPIVNPTVTPIVNPTSIPIVNPTVTPIVNPTAIPIPEDGTVGSPYRINSASDLARVAGLVNAGDAQYNAANYIVTHDIDLSLYSSWTPIGNKTHPFKGSFNGSGYAITGLTINDPDIKYAGLFGYIQNAEIRNVNILVKNVNGSMYAGGLVGSAGASGGSSVTIENCYATGSVNGDDNAGGLVGYADAKAGGSISIKNCYATGSVNGSHAGGLVGYASAYGGSVTIDNCYATGDVTGSMYAGGLVGSASALDSGSVTIENCYATGSVNGDDNAGGLVGSAYASTLSGCSLTIENCAALNPSVSGSGSVGRIAGQTSGTVNINNAYALSTMSPGSATDGKAVSPENAASQSFYNDTLKWDFGEIWKMDADISRYPVLQIQSGNSPTVTPIVNPTVTPIVNPTAIPIPEDGTVGSPYRINSASDLARVAGLVNAGDAQYNAANYIVTQDIDLSLYSSWTPIGNKTHPFKGSFNGSGYAITGLTINDPDIDYAGLFGYIQDAEIRNINLTVKNVTGGIHTGGLVGYAYAYSGGSVSIKNCYATGSVTDSYNAGGLVGYAYAKAGGSISIKNCYATGSVTGSDKAGGLVGYAYAYSGGSSIRIDNCYATGSVNGSHAGGLVGYAYAKDGGSVSIKNCYATGSVTDSDNAGGLVGYAYADASSGSSIRIENCYATGDVTGSMYAGGLVGSAGASGGSSVTIENCYATGSVTGSIAGGLVGSASADGGSVTIENCAALNPSVSGSGSVGRIAGQTSGTVNINNAYALSTMSSGSATDDKVVSPENAASQSFYKDTLKWDFDDIWNIDADISRYPYLRMNIPNAQPVKIISYVDGAIGAVIISENPVPDDLSLTVNEVPDKDALSPAPAGATLVRVYDFTLQNAPDWDYQCILNIPLTIDEMNKIPRKTLQGYHDENGKWVPCDTETIMNSDGSAIAYVKAKGFSAYMIAAVTPAVPVEYSGGSSTDTGSGHYTEYPRTVTDGGFVSFGTSPTVSSVDLPKGVSGSVILVVESKTPAPDGKPTYTVFEINIPNYPEGEEAVIQFRITLEELKKAGYDAEDICLYHCDENGVWTALPTTFTIKDGVVYYESITTAFSPFAIVYEENGATEVSQPAVTPVKTQTAEPKPTYVEPTKTAVPTPEQTKSPVGLVGLGLGLLGAFAILRRK